MNYQRLVIPALALLVLSVGVLYWTAKHPARPAQKAPEEPPIQTLVAKVAIQQGQLLNDQVVTTKPVPAAQKGTIPKDALLDPEKVYGGHARLGLQPGEYVTQANTLGPPESVSQKVGLGYVAVTIPAPDSPSLYDLKFLNPDDRVDVIGVVGDDGGQFTTTTPLCTNVRLLAVDTVYDKYKEEQRKKRIQGEIDQLQKQKDEAARRQPPPPPDQLKSYDDQITAKRAELEPKFDKPSVTIELNTAQAAKVNLWRSTPKATIKIALHRQPDVKDTLFAEEPLALPNDRVTLASSVSGVPVAAGFEGAILTLDDVVPLDKRNPQEANKLADGRRQRVLDEAQLRVQLQESSLRLDEMNIESRNLRRFGTRTAPPSALLPPVTVPPVMSQRPVDDAEADRLRRELDALRQRDQQPRSRAKPVPPPKYTPPIEVYRGSQVTTVAGS